MFVIPELLVTDILGQAYLGRISEVHEAVHALTEINPDALSIAANLDAERLKGQVRG